MDKITIEVSVGYNKNETPPSAMNDACVRKMLRTKLSHALVNKPGALVIEEFGVLHGHGRIDILVADGTLQGIEIKSETDSLKRLEKQIRIFSSTLDSVTLFVAFKHADKALRSVPDWWGVNLIATNSLGSIDIYPARPSMPNPSVDILAVSKLLWKNEALKLLESLNKAYGVRSGNRLSIYERLASVATIDQIRTHVMQCLMLRRSPLPVVEQK